jgi:hypothetical protein
MDSHLNRYINLFQKIDSFKPDPKINTFYKCMIIIKNDIFTFFTKWIYNYDINNFTLKVFEVENRDTLRLIKGFIKHYTYINHKIESFEVALSTWKIDKINQLILYFKNNLKKMTEKLKLLFKSRQKDNELIILKKQIHKDSTPEPNNKNDNLFTKVNFKRFINKMINLINFQNYEKDDNFDQKSKGIEWMNYFELIFFIMKCLKKMFRYDLNSKKKLKKELHLYMMFLENSLKYAHMYLKHQSKFFPSVKIDLVKNEKHDVSNDDQDNFYITKIYYQASKIFLNLIRHSTHLPFKQKKDYIEKIVKLQLFPILVEHLKETNYFIFYLFIVCKLLLVLFKDKNFDNNEYEEEFRSIFDPNNIRHKLKEMYEIIFTID